MATKEKSFKDKVLAGLNKSEAQVQEEKVVAFIEDAQIECNAQIAYLKTSSIPSKELEITRLKNELSKAEKAFESARFSISSTFASYVTKRNEAQQAISNAANKIVGREIELARLQAELVAFEEVLKDLQS